MVGTVRRNEVGGLTSRPVGQLYQVPIGKLVEAPWNARTDFNLAELEASIREEGILNPLIARPNPEDVLAGPREDRTTYEVFCGHRRLRAAKALGLEAVPVIVRPCGDQEARSLAIVDNLQREGLGPMDEARAFAELQKLGLTDEDVAARCVPERAQGLAYVHTRLALLELPEAAQDLVARGELSLAVAAAILRLAAPLRAGALKRVLEAKKDQWRPAGVREQVGIVADLMLPLNGAQFDTAAHDLGPRGACGGCAFRTGNQGALFGEFEGDDVCTDPACYRAKLDATLQQKARAQGLHVLKGNAAKTIFPYPNSPQAVHGDYIEVGAELRVGDYDSPKVSVRAALQHGGDKAPKPVLVQSPHDGSIHEVVPKDAVRKLAKALQRSKAKKKATKGGDESKLSKKERQQLLARRVEELKQRISQETVKAVAAAAAEAAVSSWKKLPFSRMQEQSTQLHALARIVLAGALLMGDDEPMDVAVRRGWVAANDPHQADLEGSFSEKLALMGTAEVLGVLAELSALQWERVTQVVARRGGFHPVTVTRELLESLGVDEKAVRAHVEGRVRQEEAAKQAAESAPEEKAPKKAASKASKGKGRRRAA